MTPVVYAMCGYRIKSEASRKINSAKRTQSKNKNLQIKANLLSNLNDRREFQSQSKANFPWQSQFSSLKPPRRLRRYPVEMQPGDVFVVETPGGGGYGKAEVAKQAAE